MAPWIADPEDTRLFAQLLNLLQLEPGALPALVEQLELWEAQQGAPEDAASAFLEAASQRWSDVQLGTELLAECATCSAGGCHVSGFASNLIPPAA
jgi:hypothetical protein